MDQTAQNGDQTQIPTSVVSTPQKEVEPVGAAETHLKKVEEKPEVPPELKEVGVEHVTEEVEVPYEAGRAGLSPSKEAVIPPTTPTGAVSIPLTVQQATQILKIHKHVVDAIVWLAIWCLRQLKIVKMRDGDTNN